MWQKTRRPTSLVDLLVFVLLLGVFSLKSFKISLSQHLVDGDGNGV